MTMNREAVIEAAKKFFNRNVTAYSFTNQNQDTGIQKMMADFNLEREAALLDRMRERVEVMQTEDPTGRRDWITKLDVLSIIDDLKAGLGGGGE